jgi:hypothetical protein
VFKWEVDEGYSCKWKNGTITHDIRVTKNANLADSLLEFEEITKEEYDNFAGYW